MKKRIVKVSSPERIIQTRRKRLAERSPYWDFIGRRKTEKFEGEGKEIEEDRFANPDVLAESMNQKTELTDVQEEQLRAINNALPNLTARQRAVVLLHGYNNLSMPETARRLGITVSLVQKALNGAKKKIQKRMVSKK